jgi:ribonuclease P protein component
MLKKTSRIFLTKEIRSSINSKFRSVFNSIQITSSQNNFGEAKLLVVISKKISKSAVKRNLIRRRFHWLFSEMLRLNPSLRKGYNWVLIIKNKNVIDQSIHEYFEIKDNMLNLIKRQEYFSDKAKYSNYF